MAQVCQPACHEDFIHGSAPRLPCLDNREAKSAMSSGIVGNNRSSLAIHEACSERSQSLRCRQN
jgi:hypothetical protein